MDKISLIDVIKHRISKYKLPIIIVLIVLLSDYIGNFSENAGDH